MRYLLRHPDANLKDTTAAMGIRSPSLTDVVDALVGKRWVTRRRANHDDRILCLRLSRQGEVVVWRIKNQMDCCETDMGRSNVLRRGQWVRRGMTR